MPSLIKSSKELKRGLLERSVRELIARRNARATVKGLAQYFRPEYEIAPHSSLLCDYLEKVKTGEIRRLILNMPPGHAKSEFATRYFPPYYLGHNPDHYVILATYGQDLANDFGRDVRNIVKQDEFPLIYPGLELRADSKATSRWHTRQRGGFYAVGRGKTITGRRGHLGLIDDPFKDHKEAMSKLIREQVKTWYRTVFLTRLFKTASVMITMTRWHEDDLAGWLMKEFPDDWVVVNLPAIAVKNDPLGRKEGEALWPAMFPIEYLLEIKKVIGPRSFEALYQGNPSMEEGNIFLRKNWKYWTKSSLPTKFQEIMISMDTNVEEGADNDETALVVLGKSGSSIYLLDVVHAVMGMGRQIVSLKTLSTKWPLAFKKLIEKKANGPAIQNLLKSQMSGIVMVEPQGDKVERAWAVEPSHISGCLYVPADKAEHPWVDDFIEQLAVFPNGTHDDMVDAYTQGVNYWNGPNSTFLAKITQM